MSKLLIGVGKVSLIFRSTRRLREKRRVMVSLKHRLRKRGFSVTEVEALDSLKHGCLGFSYCGYSVAKVKQVLSELEGIFIGDFQVAELCTEVLDYEAINEPEWEHGSYEEDKYE